MELNRRRALLALDGLSVGDAFGFSAAWITRLDRERQIAPPNPWAWTDETHVALSICDSLFECAEIDSSRIIAAMIRRYSAEPDRGYTGTTGLTLRAHEGGVTWTNARLVHFDDGSWGSGSSSRGAIIGAYFAGFPARAADEARVASEITHPHADAVAGTIATAVAASHFANENGERGPALLREILRFLPAGRTRSGIAAAADIPANDFDAASGVLGDGHEQGAHDTVPLALWIVANHGSDFANCLWLALNTRPATPTTLCAIIGGVLGAGNPLIPPDYRGRREPLPPEYRY